MAKKTKKETITMEKSAFIGVVLFIVAVSLLMAYAFLNYTVK